MVKRISLANFLEKLATVVVSAEEWQHYLVTHYGDDALEEARRAAVRLSLNFSIDKYEADRQCFPEVSQELQAIAAQLISTGKASKTLMKKEWWLDWNVSLSEDFVDVLWARLQVFDDLSAEVFDSDGRTIYYEDETTAAMELLEDGYDRFVNLDAEDEQELGIDLNCLQPPDVKEKEDVRILMNVRFQRQF